MYECCEVVVKAGGAQGRHSLTISEALARETADWRFEDLPPAVVHEAKRRVVDTLACGVGGYDTPSSVTLRQLVAEIGGPSQATVIGSGLKTSVVNAALANGVMVRSTEAMDRGLTSRDALTQHAHPSEVIPGILAVAELSHRSGKDTITAIALGYQLLNRLSEAMGGARETSRLGWKPEIRAGLVVPLVAGKLLGLDERQLANAVGISGCYMGALEVVDHPSEQRTTGRNLKFPYAAYKGILAALMAQRGMEGPARVFEGHHGFIEVMAQDQMDADRVTRRESDFTIRYASTKTFPVNGRLQAQVEALLEIVRKHDVAPDDIASVRIFTTRHVTERMANEASHKYPQTKETADHSAYFVAALAIVDRGVHLNLDQFTAERLTDPKLLAIIDKTELTAVEEWAHDQAPTRVEIMMTDGRLHSCTVDHPKGHAKNPLSDGDIEDKFRQMAARFMDKRQMTRFLEAAFRLDELGDVGQLTGTLTFAS